MGARRVRCILAALCAAVVLVGCESDPSYDGRPSTEWISMLDSSNAADRAKAARSLGQILAIHPRSPAVTNALVGALADSVDQVRLAAAYALAMDGVRLKGAVPGVVAALEDTAHADVRAQAALILGAFGSVAREAVLPLTAALNDPDASVRANALQALGRIGASATESGPSIVPLLHDQADYVRLSAVQALLKIRPGAEIAVPAFRDALDDSSSSVRAAAAYSLGDLGPAAAPTVAELALRIGDREPAVRGAAAFALGRIGEEANEVMPTLRAALDDPDPIVRAAVERALEQIRSDAASRGSAPHPH